MSLKNGAILAASVLVSLCSASPANAVVGYADTVLEFFDSGAGPIPGPYGGDNTGSPFAISPNVVLGPPSANNAFLSLPTGSFVTVGFTDEVIVDGVGADVFIAEIGLASESANIFISANAIDFILLGVANNDAGVSSFDLASIGYTGVVRAIRIVGLDSRGASPGFDLDYVQVLPGAIGDVPEPATWAMQIGGFGVVGASARRRRGAHAIA